MSLLEILWITLTISICLFNLALIYIFRSLGKSLDILARINYKLSVKNFYKDET